MRRPFAFALLLLALPAVAAEPLGVRFRGAGGPQALLTSVTLLMSTHAVLLGDWYLTEEAPAFRVAVRVQAGAEHCVRASLHDGEGGEARRTQSWCGPPKSLSDGARWVAHALLTGEEDVGFVRVAVRAPGLKAWVEGHVDGQELEKNGFLALPPGRYRVRLAGPDFPTRTLPVEVRRTQTVTVGR